MAKREMKTVKNEEVINEVVTPEVEETVEEVIDTPTPKTFKGVVSGCSKLNVRKKANLKADVLTVINAKAEVTVYPEDSTKDWYKVNINGVEGFCMKKFITIKD